MMKLFGSTIILLFLSITFYGQEEGISITPTCLTVDGTLYFMDGEMYVVKNNQSTVAKVRECEKLVERFFLNGLELQKEQFLQLNLKWKEVQIIKTNENNFTTFQKVVQFNPWQIRNGQYKGYCEQKLSKEGDDYCVGKLLFHVNTTLDFNYKGERIEANKAQERLDGLEIDRVKVNRRFLRKHRIVVL